MQRQTATLAEELMSGVRSRAERADDAAQQKIRRRPVADVPYAGIATRAVGLAIDVLLAQITFLTGAALVGLVASLVSDLQAGVARRSSRGCRVDTRLGHLFRALLDRCRGQTPGMRLMRLRVSDHRGHPPSLGGPVVRFFGSCWRSCPCSPASSRCSIDDRRRGLQDFLAGTTVRYVDREPLVVEIATAAEGGSRSSRETLTLRDGDPRLTGRGARRRLVHGLDLQYQAVHGDDAHR